MDSWRNVSLLEETNDFDSNRLSRWFTIPKIRKMIFISVYDCTVTRITSFNTSHNIVYSPKELSRERRIQFIQMGERDKVEEKFQREINTILIIHREYIREY